MLLFSSREENISQAFYYLGYVPIRASINQVLCGSLDHVWLPFSQAQPSPAKDAVPDIQDVQ